VKAAYRRIVLKPSGEGLAGESGFGISTATIRRLAAEIREVRQLVPEVGIVTGGGNVIRGVNAAQQGIDRASADYMGMMASVINALALQDALEKEGLDTRVLTALEIKSVAEPYIRRRAMRHLEKGRIVMFAAGTGNPYFSTDTAAALRAAEIHAEVILMAKHGTDGVYDSDPRTNSNARRYERLTFDEAIVKNLRVMDQTAIALCRENRLPIVVFDGSVPGNLQKIVCGEAIGTRVEE